MNKALDEVNSIYIRVQDYVDPTLSYLGNLNEEQWAAIQNNRNSYSQIYNLALEKMRLTLPTLSVDEIIAGYNEGCRLLQRNLSGHMAENFRHDYVPIMINAIKQPQLHTAWIFLQALANNLGQEITYLVIEALNIHGLEETALSVTEQLNITKALPQVKQLTKNENPVIASLANEVIKRLEKQL